MINANELRIGNFIKDENGVIVKINEIASHGHLRGWIDIAADQPSFKFSSPDQESFDADLCQPIALTPEILEKCGFKLLVYKDREEADLWDNVILYEITDGFVFTAKNSKRVELNEWELNDHSIADTQLFIHLHQLQNLYFALTGKEIEINL